MELVLVMAQRKCVYPGQYAPECLSAITEFGNDDNPEYILAELSTAEKSEEFASVKIVRVVVGDKAIDKALFPDSPKIAGEVKPNNGG